MENQNENQEVNQGTEERTFTQEDVNRIVQERLSRAKGNESKDLDERESELNRRELQLRERELLAEAGLPKELVGALRCGSEEEMKKSIETIKSLYGKPEPKKEGRYRVVIPGKTADTPDNIRKAMGLKG